MAATIREGREAAGMPAFGVLLNEPEIRAIRRRSSRAAD